MEGLAQDSPSSSALRVTKVQLRASLGGNHVGIKEPRSYPGVKRSRMRGVA